MKKLNLIFGIAVVALFFMPTQAQGQTIVPETPQLANSSARKGAQPNPANQPLLTEAAVVDSVTPGKQEAARLSAQPVLSEKLSEKSEPTQPAKKED